MCEGLGFLPPHLRGKSIVVFEDNEGAEYLAENPTSSARSMHIDVRHYVIRGVGKGGVTSK